MSKNFKSVICCVLTLLLVAGTIVFVFAGNDGSKIGESETASEFESEIASDVNDGEEATDEAETGEAESEPVLDTAILGDIDRNGIITAGDARSALRFAASLDEYTAEQFKLANVNGDDRLTAADARDILRVAAGLEPMFSTIVL